jgi:hypothetical protein
MNVAFKEWAVVCEALGSGRQSVIMRKGGIAEGRDGFAFKHHEFFLFPTWFHEQVGKTILSSDTLLPEQLDGEIEIRFAAVLEWSRLVADQSTLASLRPFHILADSVLAERFHYDEPKGIHVGFVRVFKLNPPSRLEMRPTFGGCRSWVDVPSLDNAKLVSVLNDDEHASRREELAGILG